METVTPSAVEADVIPDASPVVSLSPERLTELLLAALRPALQKAGEHRLFQAGKLPGLFASRHGAPAEAARAAVEQGYLEVVRNEFRGKNPVEWVRFTPKAVRFVEEHDSPRTVLNDLRTVLGETQAGIPNWLCETQSELTKLRTQFEERTCQLVEHLAALTRRVEAANRKRAAARTERIVVLEADARQHVDRVIDRLAGRGVRDEFLRQHTLGARRLRQLHAGDALRAGAGDDDFLLGFGLDRAGRLRIGSAGGERSECAADE